MAVARDHDGVEDLGQGQVHRVVSREVLAKGPDTLQQRLVRMPLQVQGPKIVERDGCGFRVDPFLPDVTPQRLRHFDIRQMGCVKRVCGILDTNGHELADRRVKDQFDQRGGVEDDHRASRSARMISAALGAKC